MPAHAAPATLWPIGPSRAWRWALLVVAITIIAVYAAFLRASAQFDLKLAVVSAISLVVAAWLVRHALWQARGALRRAADPVSPACTWLWQPEGRAEQPVQLTLAWDGQSHLLLRLRPLAAGATPNWLNEVWLLLSAANTQGAQSHSSNSDWSALRRALYWRAP